MLYRYEHEPHPDFPRSSIWTPWPSMAPPGLPNEASAIADAQMILLDGRSQLAVGLRSVPGKRRGKKGVNSEEN